MVHFPSENTSDQKLKDSCNNVNDTNHKKEGIARFFVAAAGLNPLSIWHRAKQVVCMGWQAMETQEQHPAD